MNYNINLNLLKYFYETVNEKNITKAAEKMNICQPAITRAIKELESEMNVKLLERSQKGVKVTPEGEILYEHIKEIFINLNTTLNILEDNKDKCGNLYIGTTTTNFMNFIINSLDEFKKKYKNVHIHIILEEINVLSDMEKVGKLDIVIKNNYEDIPNFKHIKTFEINDKFIASSKEFLCLKDKILSINELLNYPTVLLSNITHGRRNFNNYLKSLGIEYKPTYEFNSYSLCKELIKEGFGIGIGNPIHYESSDFLILNTDFNLPTRYFDIGYINTSKNIFIKDFIEIFNNLNK